jgi:hypothetical protein
MLQKAVCILALGAGLLTVCGCSGGPTEPVPDEAMVAGKTAADFPAADEDYFADMDYGYRRDSNPDAKLNINEVRGRNTWMVGTFGNDRFWDFSEQHVRRF